MHLPHRTIWLLAAAAGAAAGAGPSGIVEVDVVFPRPNETYAPMPILPVILGFQNMELTPYLHDAVVQFTIDDPRLGWEERRGTARRFEFDLRWANFSRSDRQFEYRALKGFDTEGTWEARWELRWATCYEPDSWPGSLNRNITIAKGPATTFTIKNGAPEPNLLSSINNCAAGSAVAFNVTETARSTSSDRFSVHDGRCPVVASATAVPDPCRIQVEAAAASSLSAAVTYQACRWDRRPEGLECEEKSAADHAAFPSWAGLAAAFGVLGFILVV